MKRSLVLILCGLLLGAAAAWAVIQFVVPRWHRSAVDNTYWQVTSKLDAGGEAFAYLHTEQVSQTLQAVLASLEKNVAALPEAGQAKARQGLSMLDAMLKGYGLDEISGLGFSSFAVKPGLHRVRIVLYHRPGRDKGLIWKIVGPAPRRLDEIGLLPADTALAFVSDYNLATLVEWMSQFSSRMFGRNAQGAQGPAPDQALAMMKAGLQMAGVDYDRLIKSYGGRLGILLALDPEKRVTLPLGTKPLSIPEPAFALLVRVNDDYLFATLKSKLTATGHNKVSEAEGVKKIVFPRMPAPFPLEPVIAQKGEWLLAASRLSLVETIFAGKTPRLADSDAFKEMAYKLPRRGNGFGYLSPLVPRLVAQALRENAAAFPVPAALEKIAAFVQQGKGFCDVWENSDQGLVYTINHGFDISSLPGLIDAFIEIARQKSQAQAAAATAPPAGKEPGK
ncbi:MAG TPA: hypothetical protein VF451_01835 [Acidobacteriota bacterium]